MKIRQWLSKHPMTSVSTVVMLTIFATLSLSSRQVRSADPLAPSVAGPANRNPLDSPLIGKSVCVQFHPGIMRSHSRFTVLDVDARTGMICLQGFRSLKDSEPCVPFWVSPSSIQFLFGDKGLTSEELMALMDKFNETYSTVQ